MPQYLSSVSVLSTATQTTFKVRANGGYSSTVSSQTAGMGCTVSSNATVNSDTEQTVTVQFATNSSISVVNSCTIQFTSVTNSVVRSINISQAASPTLVQNNIGVSGGIFYYRAINTSIKGVTLKSSWTGITTGTATSGMNCTVSPNSGNSGDGLTIGFTANTGSTVRTCNFTIATPGGNVPLVINQAGVNTIDTDGDGLLNVVTQTEFLNMQYNLAGTSYKTSAVDAGSTVGCPVSGCNGYELDNEIRFGVATSCTLPNNSGTFNPGTQIQEVLVSYDGTDANLDLLISNTNKFGDGQGTVNVINPGYGASSSFTYTIQILLANNAGVLDIVAVGSGTCTVDTTQPSTALTGFTGTFEGNGFNVSGMRIANGVRTTSASTYFTSGTIRNVTFR